MSHITLSQDLTAPTRPTADHLLQTNDEHDLVAVGTLGRLTPPAARWQLLAVLVALLVDLVLAPLPVLHPEHPSRSASLRPQRLSLGRLQREGVLPLIQLQSPPPFCFGTAHCAHEGVDSI